MKIHNLKTLLTLTLLLGFQAQAADKYSEFTVNPSSASCTAASVKSRTAVIVPGLFNEENPEEFESFKMALQTNSVFKAVKKINPSSKIHIADNAEMLNVQFRKTFQSGGKKPLVVFAHSKGAVETAYALVKYPDLLSENIVDKVFLMNAAFGSDFAEQTLKVCQENEFLSKVIIPCKKPQTYIVGVTDLKKENIKQLLENLEDIALNMNSTVNYDQLTSERVFNLRSFSDGLDMNDLGKYLVLKLMESKSGPNNNDGLVEVKNQRMNIFGKTFGTDLEPVLKFHHTFMIENKNVGFENRPAIVKAHVDSLIQRACLKTK
jgi:hypothetical protein